MGSNGYAEHVDWDCSVMALISRLASALDYLHAAALPPQWLLMFDETWEVIRRLCAHLEPYYKLRFIADIYVFDVRPGGSGWSMHRDRGDNRTKAGFRPDGLPLYTTCWLALTDASPSTSCMYVLPAHADPNYSIDFKKPLSEQFAEEDDLTILAVKSHQAIRALPVTAGTALVWSHRLVHWGAKHAGEQGTSSPRQTLAFAMADPSFEASLLTIDTSSSPPPFDARAALVAHTLLLYHHTAPVAVEMRASLIESLQRGLAYLSDPALRKGDGVGTVLQRNLLIMHAETTATLEAAAAADDNAAVGSRAKAEAVAVAERMVELLERLEDLAVEIVAKRKLAAFPAFGEVARERAAELVGA